MKLSILLTTGLPCKGFSCYPQEKNLDTVIINPQHSLSKADAEFRHTISKWSDSILKAKDYKRIVSHPSAKFEPGLPKAG